MQDSSSLSSPVRCKSMSWGRCSHWPGVIWRNDSRVGTGDQPHTAVQHRTNTPLISSGIVSGSANTDMQQAAILMKEQKTCPNSFQYLPKHLGKLKWKPGEDDRNPALTHNPGGFLLRSIISIIHQGWIKCLISQWKHCPQPGPTLPPTCSWGGSEARHSIPAPSYSINFDTSFVHIVNKFFLLSA